MSGQLSTADLQIVDVNPAIDKTELGLEVIEWVKSGMGEEWKRC